MKLFAVKGTEMKMHNLFKASECSTVLNEIAVGRVKKTDYAGLLLKTAGVALMGSLTTCLTSNSSSVFTHKALIHSNNPSDRP